MNHKAFLVFDENGLQKHWVIHFPGAVLLYVGVMTGFIQGKATAATIDGCQSKGK